jgi:DNA (cytosine-5)-methyltransferase 1
MRIKYVSAFAGIGGFDRAFEEVRNPDGSKVYVPTAFIEKEPNCQKVLARHWPHVPREGDIYDVVATAVGEPDVAVAGFPCEDISTGKARGRGLLGGDQSGTWWEFYRLLNEYLRLVDATRPRWVVIENVDRLVRSPGLVAPSKGGDGVDRTGWDLAALTRSLGDLGYVGAARVLDGRDFVTPAGYRSPQVRKRLIVVAHRGSDPRPAGEVLGILRDGPQTRAPRLIGTRKGRGPASLASAEGPGGEVIFRKSSNPRASLAKGGYETWPIATHANTLASMDWGLAGWQKHMVLHPDGRVRAFTPEEWERLQGFPTGWTEGLSDSARGEALGNAMHVGMAAWLGQRLADVHASLPLHPTAA